MLETIAQFVNLASQSVYVGPGSWWTYQLLATALRTEQKCAGFITNKTHNKRQTFRHESDFAQNEIAHTLEWLGHEIYAYLKYPDGAEMRFRGTLYGHVSVCMCFNMCVCIWQFWQVISLCSHNKPLMLLLGSCRCSLPLRRRNVCILIVLWISFRFGSVVVSYIFEWKVCKQISQQKYKLPLC